MSEAKLGMSLDDIISKSAKAKPSGGASRGIRVSGPRKGLNKNRIQPSGPKSGNQQAARQGLQQQAGPKGGRRGGAGGDRAGPAGGFKQAPLGVRKSEGQIQKRGAGGGRGRGSHSAPKFITVEVDEYGTYVPTTNRVHAPPQNFQNRAAALEGDAPWGHDLYQVDNRPPRYQEAPPPQAQQNPAKLIITNLHHNVTDADILELFSACGSVLRHKVNYDASGRSVGTAEVTFSHPAEAEEAKQKYNNIALDDQKMKIEYAASTFSAPGFQRKLGSGVRVTGARGIESRLGNPEGRSGSNNRGSRVVAQAFQQTYSQRGGGRGYGAPRGGRGGRLRSEVGKSQKDLDQEMDDFMEQ